MSDKAKSLFEAYAAGKLSRRELLTKTAQLGVAFGAANLMLNKASTDLLAADFNWKAHQGKSLKLLLKQLRIHNFQSLWQQKEQKK